MPRMRSFTQLDFMGFAGATAGPDGMAPLIEDEDVTFPGAGGVTVIADATGIQVIAYMANDEVTVWNFDHDSYAVNCAVARALPATLTPETLTAYGFSELG